MKNTQQVMELVENKELREEFVGRIEVLDRVGNLLLLDELEMATIDMVTSYYGEDVGTIKMCVKNHRDEIESDGYKVWKKNDFNESKIDLLSSTKTNFTIKLGEEQLTISNRGIALFPKRAILRIGMLLRDSDIAKELRTQLLNIAEVVKENNDEMLVQEIDKEKQLLLNIMFAKSDTERAIAVNEHVKYVERYKQKAERYDKVYEAPTLFTITQIAKDLGMSGQKLNKILNKKGIIYKGKDGVWALYSKYEHLCPSYCDYHVTEYGQALKWKNKGREWIINLLQEDGAL